MNCHLVTVKVSIESRTYQGVNLDGTAINEHRLKRLNAEAVQGGGAIKQYRPLLDHLFKYVVDLWLMSLHQSASTLNIVGKPLFYQPPHNERLEQLHCHSSWQSALVQLELGANNNNRAPAIVNPLAQ